MRTDSLISRSIYFTTSGNIPDIEGKAFLKKLCFKLLDEHSVKLEVVAHDSSKGEMTIFLVDPEDFISDTFYNTIAKYFECITPNSYKPVPIVFIGVPDLSIAGQLAQEGPDINVKGLNKIFPSDPRINVLDCSIWTRYVSIESKDFILKVKEALGNTRCTLFKEPVALEYAELYGRLITNNRLIGIEKSNGQDAHKNYVVPFPFHSESRLMIKSAAAMKGAKADVLEKLQGTHWRILMVDDKALKHERIKEIFSKKGIVILDDKMEPDAGKINVSIEWVDKVEGEGITASKKLKDQQQYYDVIMLDFLLGKKEDNRREYGTALFSVLNSLNISSHSDDDFLETNWIMSVSSFYNTFLDELRDICPLLSNRWIVQRGGDPLTTPELFFYEFITLALFKLDKIWPAESWFQSIWKKYIESFHGMLNKGNSENVEAKLKTLSRQSLYLLQKTWTRYNTYKDHEKQGLIKSLLAKHPQIKTDFQNVYPLLRKLFDTLAFESRNNYRNAEVSFNDIISYYFNSMTDDQILQAESLKKYILNK